MALYKYVKKVNKKSILARVSSPRAYKARVPRKVLVTFSLAFFLAGVFLVGQVVFPIVGWYVFTLPSYSGGIATPLATSFHPEKSPLYPVLVRAEEAADPNYRNSSFDASSWFAGAKDGRVNSDLKVYTLSIPKLGIDSATVEIGGEDLKKSLVAWPSSALPGSFGNNIVFGHSELPEFASPKNYSGIFTHIMDLASGDEIYLDYDGVRYKYEVTDKKVVEPTDLDVLEQRFDAAYVTLITCVPPGTLWKRGVVTGRLTQI